LARLAMLLMPGLALLLLGAHFFRAGSAPLAGLCAALVALRFVRAPWAARTVQVAMLTAVAAWLVGRHALGQHFGLDQRGGR
jgi:hypothetical protein